MSKDYEKFGILNTVAKCIKINEEKENVNSKFNSWRYHHTPSLFHTIQASFH